jgi:hypothetical protein
MLKWGLALGLLALALWGTAMSFTHSYEECEAKHGAKYSQPYKPSGDEKVETLLRCQGESLDANGDLLTAIGTLAIAIFTWTLWRSTDRASEHFRASERAYMLMSHKSGLQIEGQKIGVTMQIRNWGKTPGTVTDNVLGPVFFAGKGRLPPKPDYNLLRTANPEAFLAPSGKIQWTQEFEIGIPDLAEVTAGRITLIMFGYVDYRDQFGGRFRNGYAREYGTVLTPDGNNLGFVRDAPGYNYDRPRERGEGNDWNDA